MEAPWQSNFGTEADFALGIEEELLLVDGENQLATSSAEVREAADPDEGEVTSELYRAMVETRSEVSRNASEAIRHLRSVRAELRESEARIMAVGVHPSAEPGEAAFDGARRYAAIQDSLQGVLRTPICGQHIHVGMPDSETAVRAYNGIRTHVPLLNALAANSPYWFGEDSGLASSRTVIFRSYPRAAMAPAFEDYDDFVRVTRQVCAAAGIEDYSHIWWDARIHPTLGTIELRAADTQTELWRAAALGAMVHCLVRVEADRWQGEIPAREALAESSFQATRHGLDADLLDRRAEPVPARDLASSALDDCAEVAGELGCEKELGDVQRILDLGTGAEGQRRAHAELGMEGLLDWLVERSMSLN